MYNSSRNTIVTNKFVSRYIQLGSLGDLMATDISVPAVIYFLEEWRMEMRLVTTLKVGLKL